MPAPPYNGAPGGAHEDATLHESGPCIKKLLTYMTQYNTNTIGF